MLLGLSIQVCGCTLARAGIALAPQPAYPVDSAAQTAFAIVEQIARRHGMQSFRSQEGQQWRQCFGLRTLFLCGTVYQGEVQFRMDQPRASHFSPRGDSIRLEIIDSLQSRFGRSRVRECDWVTKSAPPGSGCKPSLGSAKA